MSEATSIKHEKQVPNELDRLNDAADRLGKLVEELMVQLSSVLSQPEPPEEKSKEEEGLAPLPSSIRVIRYRIQAYCKELKQLTERLEL